MAKKPANLKINNDVIVKDRIGRQENQSDFWRRLGVTQSGGSRYESGRNVPRVVRMLYALETGRATLDDLRSGRLAASA